MSEKPSVGKHTQADGFLFEKVFKQGRKGTRTCCQYSPVGSIVRSCPRLDGDKQYATGILQLAFQVLCPPKSRKRGCKK